MALAGSMPGLQYSRVMGHLRSAREACLRCGLAAAVGLAGAPAAVLADVDCDSLRDSETILQGELVPLGRERWVQQALPSKGDVDDSLERLDANDEPPLVYAVELNGDRRPELLLTTADGRLCGKAGCPYVLLAPRTLKRIGEFFAQELAMLDARINGYRIVQSNRRHQPGVWSLDTHVFERQAYRLVSHVLVDACALEQWRRRMRAPR